jgi:hypothetical protein
MTTNLPSYYLQACRALLAKYVHVLTPYEYIELLGLCGQAVMTPLQRARLSVIARIAIDRMTEVRDGD